MMLFVKFFTKESEKAWVNVDFIKFPGISIKFIKNKPHRQ